MGAQHARKGVRLFVATGQGQLGDQGPRQGGRAGVRVAIHVGLIRVGEETGGVGHFSLAAHRGREKMNHGRNLERRSRGCSGDAAGPRRGRDEGSRGRRCQLD